MDIFFVLSGFLISYILYKEFLKYDGKIDIWNFYRGRFLRLWPMIFLWIVCRVIVEGLIIGQFNWTNVSCLAFVNNWLGAGDQGWSLAVEFQFYLISPWLVYWMARSNRPILMPIIMCLVCIILRGIFTYMFCPAVYNFKSTMSDLALCNYGKFAYYVYIQTWTRMAPYVCGMYAAYLHVNDKEHTLMTNSPGQIILEWLSLFVLVAISLVNISTMGVDG